MKIGIINYGMGNLGSVRNALCHLGCDVTIVASEEQMHSVDALILPGVGAFGMAMDNIRQANIDGGIRNAVEAGKPLLGICLGMQLLLDASQEMGAHDGLGLIPGNVLPFSDAIDLRVPHMGWNDVQIRSESIFSDWKIENASAPRKSKGRVAIRGRGGQSSETIAEVENPSMYFVHSYYCAPDQDGDIIGTTDYGLSYASVIGRGNVFGCQFHPEKSQRYGLRFLQNYLEYCRAQT